MAKKQLIIDCERMKYPDTGLYHFCRELSFALLRQPGFTLNPDFYVPKNQVGFLHKKGIYQTQHWWHKIINTVSPSYTMWHCTYQGSNYFPYYKSVKKIYTIHDLNPLFDERKSKEKIEKYLQHIQRQVQACSYITAISQFTLDCVQQHIDVKNIPAKVIYNGCNLPPLGMQFVKPSFIVDDTPYIFSIGTIAVKKNFHVLPALLKGNQYKLIIAGIKQDADYFNKIISLAKEQGVQDRLILAGSVSEQEKFWLMQHMMAFVFPSVSEGFGLPVIEAMHFGKPVILSSLTCLPEIGSDAAYYFPSFDAADMQQCFIDAMQHFEANTMQAQKVKQRAADFSWDKAAREYIDVYNEVLAK